MSDRNLSRDASRHATGGLYAGPQDIPVSQIPSPLASRIRGTRRVLRPSPVPEVFVSNVMPRISSMLTVRVHQELRMETLPALTRTPLRTVPKQASRVETAMIPMSPTLPGTPNGSPVVNHSRRQIKATEGARMATSAMFAHRSWAKV